MLLLASASPFPPFIFGCVRSLPLADPVQPHLMMMPFIGGPYLFRRSVVSMSVCSKQLLSLFSKSVPARTSENCSFLKKN